MHILAADNSGAGGAIVALVILMIELGVIILMLAGMWKAFVKAGEPGWAAIIPIYNTVIIIKLSGKPIWWIALLLIPCVSVIFAIILLVSFAQAYGKGVGFALGMIFLPFIFWPLLGFGDAQYVGTKSF